MAKHWKIQGIDSLTVFYETTIPFWEITEKQIVPLLQRLAAKHLTEDEIMACSLRKDAMGHHDRLQVRNENSPGRVLLYTTLDPHYLATVVDTEAGDMATGAIPR